MTKHLVFLFCAALLGCDKTTPAETKADNKTAKAETKSDAKSETKSDAKPETKADDKAAIAAEPAAAASVFTCDAVEKHKHCTTATPIPGLEDGLKAGCEVGSGGAWKAGDHCPKEKIVATCKKEMHSEVKYFYEGTKLDLSEKACTSFSGTWALGA